MSDIETGNRFGVSVYSSEDRAKAAFPSVGMSGVGGSHIIHIHLPLRTMTPDQAITLAAWLAVLAEPHATHPLAEVRKAVEST